MNERSTFDPFEQLIADELGRYTAGAVDHKSATEIAAIAMRPRSLVVRGRNAPRRRRFLLLGLAATLLVPATYFGAAGLRPPHPPTDDAYTSVAPTGVAATTDVAIFVRRDEGADPGDSIFAVRPDGGEALIRKVPDSITNTGGKLQGSGVVSPAGWLALAVESRPWPMVIVDLRNVNATPWVVPEASTGGIGPQWGPTGLIAADAGGTGDRVVVGDPETRSTRILSMPFGLVGGGPQIVWTGDGGAIVSRGSEIVSIPIDGGDGRPGVGDVFDPRGQYGPGLAQLRVCLPGMDCPDADDGRIERLEVDGRSPAIWQQSGPDRALTASFAGPRDYLLSLDHDSGRQIQLVRLHDGVQDVVATVNRDADWEYVGANIGAQDQSMMVVGLVLGTSPAAVVVSLTGSEQSFHTGQFAGFVERATSGALATGQYLAPVAAMPVVGQPYALPSVDKLIAAELRLNPGRTVLGSASGEANAGEPNIRTFEVKRDHPGDADVYFDCLGPSSATVAAGGQSATEPCIQGGASVFTAAGTVPVIVNATSDTSWRVVMYSPPS